MGLTMFSWVGSGVTVSTSVTGLSVSVMISSSLNSNLSEGVEYEDDND